MKKGLAGEGKTLGDVEVLGLTQERFINRA